MPGTTSALLVAPGSALAPDDEELFDTLARRSPPPATRSGGTDWVSAIPFFALHAMPFAAIWTGVTLRAALLCVVLYATRMLAITLGYHRYFAHRTYRLRRLPQLAVAIVGATAAQKGPLWWAAHHRAHHRYADTERDVHSPVNGFWWSHAGWILARRFKETDFEAISDFAKYPELRFVNRFQAAFPWALGVASYFVAGWPGVVVGFALSTVLMWHATFCINSVAHLWGRRRYETPDTSRNSLALSILTFGEGWHNNHHNYPPSARLGERWWELDIGWWVLAAGRLLGLVKAVRLPSARALSRRRLPTS